MHKERVTSSEVAKLAGVSQSAVSRCFTPGASVSKKTADKVKAAAAELGYRPNVLARSLITGSSRVIGLVVAYLNNQFYPDAIMRLSNELQAQGYHILIFMADSPHTNVDNVVQEILDYQVDGIVIAASSLSSEIASRCQSAGISVVFFNRAQDDPNISSVESDNIAGGRDVATHLIACGYSRFGYIAGWENASTQRDRELGFRQGLTAQGYDLAFREVGNFNYDEACAATRRMFESDDRPEAVFVANDHMAFAVMDTLRHELGLRIPDDVAVVGYDDVPLAAWPSYQLTTIRQRSNLMVAETIRLLLQSAATRTVEHIKVDAPLMVRGSTKQIT